MITKPDRILQYYIAMKNKIFKTRMKEHITEHILNTTRKLQLLPDYIT